MWCLPSDDVGLQQWWEPTIGQAGWLSGIWWPTSGSLHIGYPGSGARLVAKMAMPVIPDGPREGKLLGHEC